MTVGIPGGNARGWRIAQQALTPSQVLANTSAEQTFTVYGLSVGDFVSVNKPTAQAGLGIVGTRVSATNTLAITFANFTGSPITPTAGEQYIILNGTPESGAPRQLVL